MSKLNYLIREKERKKTTVFDLRNLPMHTIQDYPQKKNFTQATYTI